jgi:4a-hydroxytetrahydrobiopterin dehydratase
MSREKPSRDRMSNEQIAEAVKELPHWYREGDALLRTLRAPEFLDVIRIVVAVAEEAEAMDHHPDMDIRWTTLHFALSTHDVGGITAWDVKLAGAIDKAVDSILLAGG